jgi:uncharacterized protein YjbJ (UPF0337 family)
MRSRLAWGLRTEVSDRVIDARPVSEEPLMNWDRIEGNWKQFKGRVKEQWGKLTDDEIDVIAGKRDQLVGKIQESYGITKDEAEKQVNRFGDSFRDEDLRTYQ